MGFYDCRCLLTGVSLKGARVALVLLQPAGDEYEPISLAIEGSYNRLGSIDNIVDNSHGQLVVGYFQQAIAADEVVCDEEYLRSHGCWPLAKLGDLLQACERNINDELCVQLNGQPVVFALISAVVFRTFTTDLAEGTS